MKQLAFELFFLRSKQDAGDAHQRLLNIPRRGDVLEGEFKVAAFPGNKRRSLRRENSARLAQNDLAKLIGEFDSELDICEREIALIRNAAGDRGDFLIQKILGTAERHIFNFKFRGVSLLNGSKGKMRLASA